MIGLHRAAAPSVPSRLGWLTADRLHAPRKPKVAQPGVVRAVQNNIAACHVTVQEALLHVEPA